MLYPIYVRNATQGELVFDELAGLILPAGEREKLHDSFSPVEIAESQSLKNYINSGDAVITTDADGTNELSKEDAINYIEIPNKKFVIDNFFSKTELQTPGQSQVHWDNVSDKPAIGSPAGWLNPVKYRVRAINPTVYPDNSKTGDVFVAEGYYKKYNGSNWEDIAPIAEGDRVIDLSSSDQKIFKFNGISWEDAEGNPKNNFVVVVSDDGDAKTAQYTYDESQHIFIKTSDADFVGLLPRVDNLETKTENIQSTLDKTKIVNGIRYEYDEVRGKWLSTTRMYLQFGYKGEIKNRYLITSIGNQTLSTSSEKLLRNATITGITADLGAIGTCNLCVRRKGDLTNLEVLSLNNLLFNQKEDCSADFGKGESIQIAELSQQHVKDVKAMVEVAWRL
ncbi:MAG: hypothetical protein HQK79_20200 [Desulfobacterales bacterium]|nr:hypothetical protein [Desulfobacterales bacterium]